MRLIIFISLSLFICLPTRADTDLGDVCYMLEDYACALKEYEASGFEEASMYGLGLLYLRGHGVEQDYEKANDWFTRAGRNGSMDATYELGKMYVKGQHVTASNEQARKLFDLAVGRDHVPSMVALGALYRNFGTDAQRKQALGLFTRAAEADNADANYHIFLYYLLGGESTIEKNPQAGLAYLIKAADGGNDEAGMMLAGYYGEGKYVEKDLEKAYEYVEYSAYGGYPQAMRAAYITNFQGIGTEKDILLAGVWLTLAHDADPETNAKNYQEMQNGLSDEQKAEITRMIDEEDF